MTTNKEQENPFKGLAENFDYIFANEVIKSNKTINTEPNDIRYLDEKFPKEVYYQGVKKPESQLRGEAMVLLTLARQEGRLAQAKEDFRLITSFNFDMGCDECCKNDIKIEKFRMVIEKQIQELEK
jgi:hypothetical protein